MSRTLTIRLCLAINVVQFASVPFVIDGHPLSVVGYLIAAAANAILCAGYRDA